MHTIRSHHPVVNKSNSDNSSDSKTSNGSSTEGIQYPGVHDVVCGRGGHSMTHPGNLKFRTLVESFKPSYEKGSKLERQTLAANILTLWRSQTPHGRFLIKTHPHQEDSLWHDVGDVAALKKVNQTLRERRSYPMLSHEFIHGSVLHTGNIRNQNQNTSHQPLPVVDAIITAARQQEQIEKIRLVEEEIKRLQQQNITQRQMEERLRQQCMVPTIHNPLPAAPRLSPHNVTPPSVPCLNDQRIPFENIHRDPYASNQSTRVEAMPKLDSMQVEFSTHGNHQGQHHGNETKPQSESHGSGSPRHLPLRKQESDSMSLSALQDVTTRDTSQGSNLSSSSSIPRNFWLQMDQADSDSTIMTNLLTKETCWKSMSDPTSSSSQRGSVLSSDPTVLEQPPPNHRGPERTISNGSDSYHGKNMQQLMTDSIGSYSSHSNSSSFQRRSSQSSSGNWSLCQVR